MLLTKKLVDFLCWVRPKKLSGAIKEDIAIYKLGGGLAQLARALRLHRRGHRFDSDILH